jgi:hypothetical protein
LQLLPNWATIVSIDWDKLVLHDALVKKGFLRHTKVRDNTHCQAIALLSPGGGQIIAFSQEVVQHIDKAHNVAYTSAAF